MTPKMGTAGSFLMRRYLRGTGDPHSGDRKRPPKRGPTPILGTESDPQKSQPWNRENILFENLRVFFGAPPPSAATAHYASSSRAHASHGNSPSPFEVSLFDPKNGTTIKCQTVS
jgi:hypothetical protein